MAPLPPPRGAYPAGEAFPALRTFVHSGGRGRAFPDVGAQEFLLAEALAAGQAGEGLLSSVGSGMNRQVAPLEGGENSRQLFTGTFCVRHYYRMFLSPPKMSARLRKVAARAVGAPCTGYRASQSLPSGSHSPGGLEAHEAPTCLRLPDRMTTNLHVE